MIKFKKIYPNSIAPMRAHPSDAGADLFVHSTEIKHTKRGKSIPYAMLGTGIAVEIPEGYYGLLVPRSSTFKNYEIQMTSPGIIDASYRGEIFIPVKSAFGGMDTPSVKTLIGERVAQLIILPCVLGEFVEVEELEDTLRGDGGFGSTTEITIKN